LKLTAVAAGSMFFSRPGSVAAVFCGIVSGAARCRPAHGFKGL
jgi:hypothetical protein